MERDNRPRTAKGEYSFSDLVNGVQKSLISGLITEREALLTTSIHAFIAITRIEKGVKVKDPELAVDFLTRNWDKIPQDLKLRFMKSDSPRENK